MLLCLRVFTLLHVNTRMPEAFLGRLKMSRSIHLLSLYAFMAWMETTLRVENKIILAIICCKLLSWCFDVLVPCVLLKMSEALH